MPVYFKVWYYLPFLACLFLACNKDEMQAEESLEGEWEVVAADSHYGVVEEFDFGNSFSISESASDTGQLGTFLFTQNTVEFSFLRNDTLYEDSTSWNLDLERQREGFSRTNRFTLTIDEDFLFEVTFGNDIRNSEENATSITFIEEPNIPGPGVMIQLMLEKL